MGAVGAAAPTDFEMVDSASTDFEEGCPGNLYFFCMNINFLVKLDVHLKICTHSFKILTRPLIHDFFAAQCTNFNKEPINLELADQN